ncbi:MAG: O-antigen ligase family protein [Flavobacteriales bacterium]|nr:O-antigen ligase family protein [Flavobacteriales bacterium]
MVFDRNNIAQLIFLELLSLTPLFILIGNIVPPIPFIPLKIHFIAFGIIFLCSLWILVTQASKKWVLYVAFGYLLIQFTFDYWDLKSWIDFFFGPFVLVILVDLLVNKRIPTKLLKKYEQRFYHLLWIPISIAVLQFFEILPVTFWNASYVNYVLVDGVDIPRPNGFLYHGSELSIILCFTALFQYFKKERESFWMLVFLIFICLATYFKAILGCITLLFLYYLIFVNRGVLSRFQVISKARIFWYGGVLIVIGICFAVQYSSMVYFYTGNYFPPQMLTGRGSIWNIYLSGIKEFSWWNHLVGNGMGSAFEIFKEQATSENFYPLVKKSELGVVYDTHNAILSIFVNSGLIGLLFISFIFKMIYTQIKTWKPTALWNKKVFIAVFIIPLMTIGVTINFYEMAIIWPCIGFVFYRWFFSTQENDAVD